MIAAQGDSVIANDVDAHGWGLLIDLRGCACDPTHALFSGQSQSIRDNVMALFGAIRAWKCSAANLARTGADFGNVEPNPNRTMPWSGRRHYPPDCRPGLSGNIGLTLTPSGHTACRSSCRSGS